MKKRALSLTLVVVLQGCSGEALLPSRTSVEPSPPVQTITLPQPQPDESDFNVIRLSVSAI